MKRPIRSTRPHIGLRDQADLHVHTTSSDGAYSPGDVISMAYEEGLIAVGITDHDTIHGIAHGLEAGKDLSMEVIPGVEISAGMGSHEVHILGYYIDETNGELVEKLERFQNVRLDRIERMITQLKTLGINLDFQYVLSLAGEGAVGRPHVARALVEYGYVGTMSEAFDTLIGDDKPGYVPRLRISPKDAIDLIHRSGGVACWAHPGLESHDEWLEEFVSYGLDGLEIAHPEHSARETAQYRAMADRYTLLVTGGSDFHGGEIGGGPYLGQCTTDYEDLNKLREAAFEIRRTG